MISNEEYEQLEKLVDAHSIKEVLEALVCICGDKAEHLQTNWQDSVSAQTWDDHGQIIDLAYEAIR